MRYSLRTLLIVATLGPPLLAALWIALSYLPQEAMFYAYVLQGAIVGASLVAALVGVAPLLDSFYSVIANGLNHLLTHRNNRH